METLFPTFPVFPTPVGVFAAAQQVDGFAAVQRRRQPQVAVAAVSLVHQMVPAPRPRLPVPDIAIHAHGRRVPFRAAQQPVKIPRVPSSGAAGRASPPSHVVPASGVAGVAGGIRRRVQLAFQRVRLPPRLIAVPGMASGGHATHLQPGPHQHGPGLFLAEFSERGRVRAQAILLPQLLLPKIGCQFRSLFLGHFGGHLGPHAGDGPAAHGLRQRTEAHALEHRAARAAQKTGGEKLRNRLRPRLPQAESRGVLVNGGVERDGLVLREVPPQHLHGAIPHLLHKAVLRHAVEGRPGKRPRAHHAAHQRTRRASGGPGGASQPHAAQPGGHARGHRLRPVVEALRPPIALHLLSGGDARGPVPLLARDHVVGPAARLRRHVPAAPHARNVLQELIRHGVIDALAQQPEAAPEAAAILVPDGLARDGRFVGVGAVPRLGGHTVGVALDALRLHVAAHVVHRHFRPCEAVRRLELAAVLLCHVSLSVFRFF